MTSMFTDHSGLSDMVQVAKLNGFRSTSTRFGLVQSFWASSARAATDGISDVLEISLTDSYLINALQFDLAKFPHVLRVEYWNEASQLWVSLTEADGSECVRYISQCVPVVIPPSGSVTGHQHPQHSIVGHWQTETIALAPIEVQRIRLQLTRMPSATIPLNTYGKPVDYSLAVRNLSLGFTVSALNDVPRTLPSTESDRSYFEPFGSGDDVVSSNIDFSVRKLDADRIIADGADDQIWRCEPQPDPNCVVNMFADVRTPEGDPQVVDRIWMDPTNNGVHVTLYYANEAPTSGFLSPDKPLPTDAVDSGNEVYVDKFGLHMSAASISETYDPSQEGDTHYVQNSYPMGIEVTLVSDGTVYELGTDYEIIDAGLGQVHLVREPAGSIPTNSLICLSYTVQQSVVLDNAGFNYDTSMPWWVGFTVQPQFDPADLTDPQSSTLFDCGAWRLDFTGEGLSLTTSHGDSISLPLLYQRSLQVCIVVSYDGTNIGLWAVDQLDQFDLQIPVQPLDTVTRMAIGSTVDRSNYGSFIVSSMVIKEETPTFDGSAYAADPRSFAEVDAFADDEPDTSRLNAILRFDPVTALQSSAYPWCIFGGTPSKYEAMVWTPVSREYTTQRGWMELPPIRASYWKLEFTSLPPVYADIAVPVSQQVKHFSGEQISVYRARLAAADPSPSVADQAHASVVGFANYLDTPVVVSTGGTGQGYTNTEVYVADDLAAAERLYDQQPSAWAYQQHLSPQSAPRFTRTQVHTYDLSLVQRNSKVAYQIGLRTLRFARTTFSSKYDTPQYIEMLYDTDSLDPNTNWVFEEDRFALTSGNSDNAKIVSSVYLSNRDVRGVQFAAQQSPPVQLLTDADFEDPNAALWHVFGDARLGEMEESNAFGNLLPVVRSLPVGQWGDIPARYTTWGGIESAGATWGDLVKSINVANSPNASRNGGISSEAIELPAGGYLHAAARVVVKQQLTSPLWLQIVDSVTGAVLAEESVSTTKGQVAEWYTSYALGSALAEGGVTWGELSGNIHYASYLDLFSRSDSSSLGRMDSGQGWDAGQRWNGSPGNSLEIVSNRAKVTSAGQRSVVDVGTPWGKFVVQIGPLTAGSGELMDIGGILLLSNGQLIDSETGHLYASLTLSTNDTLQFETMPTSQVPPAHASGADASILSWSMVVTRNGSFVTTISFARPTSTVRGISGAVGQQFRSFAFTPVTIPIPIDTLIQQNPIPRDGQIGDSGQSWIQTSDDRPWYLDGTYDVVDNGIRQSLQVSAGVDFAMTTDVGSKFGAMTARIGLSGTSAADSYNVLVLDDGSSGSLYLRADGALVQFTPALGPVVLAAGAVPSFSDTTTVVFADTAKLTSAFMTAHSLSTSLPQTLIFLNGNSVVSTYQGTSLWMTSVRGVAGADGSTITGFTWAPNLGAVSNGSGLRTWGDLSANGTRTWGDIARTTEKLTNPVVARVMQKDPSYDVWYMNSAPVFFDPIVWEFSNDGGDTYTQASKIRNNPKGVVLLDTGAVNANRLRYRVTSFNPNTWLSHLVIRPWYQGHMRDVPVRPPAPHGPNLNPLDGYCTVDEDANFQVWSLPIPREWWFSFRSILPGVGLPSVRNPVATERFVL